MRQPIFTTHIYEQLTADELTKQTLTRKEGVLNDTGALMVNTGAFTGRSPDDKFIVRDKLTHQQVDWNKFNNPFGERDFIKLKEKMIAYLDQQQAIWARNAYVCADLQYRLPIRLINEYPWGNHFAANMFLEPEQCELQNFTPDWLIIQAPGFKADPITDGTKKGNFTVMSFTHKTILIGGTAYTGEIKKSVFTALNYILPLQKNVLSMHCSANEGEDGDTALFFGLSGTGKTTLSAAPGRRLIGDDEHGWSDRGVFNFEGGCYAKIINLSAEYEPDIFKAIRPGALVENATRFDNSYTINFADKSITENTRASYPLSFINHAKIPSVANAPRNIFFLTCDAYGVLPPVSRLTHEQALYHFLNGYTAKIAGTEEGISEPKVTFSTCFGAPFLPLQPEYYAALLDKKLKGHEVKTWLINTGWTGGPYGKGARISIQYTRAMVDAALKGSLDHVDYQHHFVFGLWSPLLCPGVPSELLNPRETWADKNAYDQTAARLARQFERNYECYRMPQLTA